MTIFKRPKVSFIGILLLCVLLVVARKSHAQEYAFKKNITVNFSSVKLLAALDTLGQRYSLPLSYDPDILPLDKIVSGNFIDKPLLEVLRDVLSQTGCRYQLVSGQFIISPIGKVSISGRVIDAESGELLIGAAVYVPSIKQGIVANNYGFYSLTLPPGNYTFSVSHVGYSTINISKQLFSNENQVFAMKKEVSSLPQFEVHPSLGADSLSQLKNGTNFDWNLARKKGYFKGEADALQALQMENGILPLTEGSSYLFVRGGNRDQNLIMLDEATIYNPAHLFGLTSVFNPDAIKNIEVYTGAIPATFGGRLSSVIDVRTVDGDNQRYRVKGGASLLAVRLSIEGPIVKEKSSFVLSARRSINNLLSRDLKLFDLYPNYDDVNFKANYKLGRNDRVYLSGYLGRDRVFSENEYLNIWGNQAATLRWNHVFGPKVFVNVSAIHSRYRNYLTVNADSSDGTTDWVTGISDATFKTDFSAYPNPNNQFQYGSSSIFHLFIPGESENTLYNNIERTKAQEHALYFSHRYSGWQKIRLSYGLRASIFRTVYAGAAYELSSDFDPVPIEEVVDQIYVRFEPRFSLQYNLSNSSHLQFDYNRTYQYLQLVQNDELAFSSLESWIPAGINLKPQRSDFFSLQYRSSFLKTDLLFTVYYKKMQHQLELTDHAQIISNPFIEGELRSGKSDAYGLEISLKRNFGNVGISAMYVYSRVFKQISGINNGKEYPAGYDIPHAVKLNLNWALSKSISMNAYFNYSSGRPVTLPVGYFEQKGIKVPVYGERNGSRMPSYHRADLTFQWSPLPFKVGKREMSNVFTVGIYNVYNRKNLLFYQINQGNIEEVNFDRQSFSGRTLGLSYTFNF